MIMLMMIGITSFAQPCIPVDVVTFTFNKPTYNGQIIGTIYGCDQDANTVLTYRMTSGSTKYWTVVKSTIDPLNAYVIVNNSAQLNKDPNHSYLLTVMVTDNTGLKSKSCKVIINY